MSIRRKLIQLASKSAVLLGGSASGAADFFLGRQNSDGGFRGKGPQSDLYYTGFAVLGLSALDLSFDREKVLSFLHAVRSVPPPDLAHLASLVRLLRLLEEDAFLCSPVWDAVHSHLETFRSGDGGYHHIQAQADSSAYGNFLALGICEDLEIPFSQPEAVLAALDRLRTKQGGYFNEPQIPAASVPAAAAALAVRCLLGQKGQEAAVEWILSCADEQGGFRVMPMAPVPDLLSTAVALFALTLAQADYGEIATPCSEFVLSLWHKESGFFPNVLDSWSDCEYTFYGLLAAGALADA